MASIDDAKNCQSVTQTTPAQHKKRRPQEATSVVSAKDPPKVKSENFLHNSRVPELG